MSAQLHRNLRRGKPADWVVPVYCATLDEFLDFHNWGEIIGILFLEVDKLNLSVDTSDPKLKWSVYSGFLQQQIEKLKPFFEVSFGATRFVFSTEGFAINGTPITPALWEEFLQILVVMYSLDLEALRPAPAGDDNVAELRARMARTRETVNRVKAKEGRAVTIDSLIDGVCGQDPSLNFLNIFELTYYQFSKTLESIHKSEDFHFAMSALMNGADPKKVKPKHWSEG